METEMTVIEINGVKMEVDLRRARIVHENLRVGTKVKLLVKSSYETVVHAGVVVGFEPFKDLPTLIVAYLVSGYAAAELKFAYVNAKTADKFDLVPAVDDELPVEKADVVAVFDREEAKKCAELDDIRARKAFFLKHFDAYFVPENSPVA